MGLDSGSVCGYELLGGLWVLGIGIMIGFIGESLGFVCGVDLNVICRFGWVVV